MKKLEQQILEQIKQYENELEKLKEQRMQALNFVKEIETRIVRLEGAIIALSQLKTDKEEKTKEEKK